MVFTEALQSPVGSKQRAAAFQSQSQLPSLTGQRLKTHRATLNMEAEVHFPVRTFMGGDTRLVAAGFSGDLLLAAALKTIFIS